MARHEAMGQSGRRIVDLLPAGVGLLPGEIDLVFRYLGADLDTLLEDSNKRWFVTESNYET